MRALGAPVMVTDSSAVRAYTGKCRWMGDIDLLVQARISRADLIKLLAE